jgi:hypothetical protein
MITLNIFHLGLAVSHFNNIRSHVFSMVFKQPSFFLFVHGIFAFFFTAWNGTQLIWFINELRSFSSDKDKSD